MDVPRCTRTDKNYEDNFMLKNRRTKGCSRTEDMKGMLKDRRLKMKAGPKYDGKGEEGKEVL